MRTCSARCEGRGRAAAALLLAALAMEGRADEPSATLERVVVTGSNLLRTDAETALPVQVINRAEIERSGVATVEELVTRISANVASFNEATGVGDANHPGFSGVSLRGLGAHSTLVLLNGRRLANYAFSDELGIGVDLHAIPLAAIDRVEVLKDGASAIYGSDAIGGVINFILRENFQGVAGSVERSFTQRGGGAFGRETLTVGLGDASYGGWNTLAVVDHTLQHALSASDRSYARTAFRPDLGIDRTSPVAFPANVITANGLVNPSAPTCSAHTVSKGTACFYDYAAGIDLVPRAENMGLLLRGSANLGAASHLYAELLGSRTQLRYLSSPTPLGNPRGVLPEGSPYYPAGMGLSGDLNLLYRAEPLGPRITRITTDQARGVLGWRGPVSEWDADAALLHSTTRSVSDYISGFADASALFDAIGTGLVNPFGASGPDGNALLAGTLLRGRSREGRGTTTSADMRARRDLARWSAGTLSLALGAEVRAEDLDDHTTELNDRTAGGTFHVPSSGSRRAQAAYAELLVPVVPTLEAQLAVRTDHYSDFGTTTNPKVALRWQPSTALVLRGSAGSGFRAPSLPELFAAQNNPTMTLGLADPKRCPVTQSEADCHLEVPLRFGGNPKLQPETSRQYSVGFVFEPAKGSSIGIDGWRIAVDRTITELGSDTILSGNDRYEGKNIERGPIDPNFPTLPGPIIGLVEITENIGRLTASGIDVDMRWRSQPTQAGRFSAQLVGSYISTWRFAFDGINESSLAGTYGGVPRWQHTLTLGWERGPWTATLAHVLRSGMIDANPEGAPPRRSAAWQVCNAQIAYSSLRNLTLVAGVRNLFDREPPASNQLDAFQIGYDPAVGDPRGRTLVLRATYQWR